MTFSQGNISFYQMSKNKIKDDIGLRAIKKRNNLQNYKIKLFPLFIFCIMSISIKKKKLNLVTMWVFYSEKKVEN